MKRLLKVLLSAALTASLVLTALPATAADKPINVTLDGKPVSFPDAKPFIVSGRVMVPVRFVSEALGAEVEWISSERAVVIQKNGTTIKLETWMPEVNVNGEIVGIDASPRIVQNRIFVPLRFISQTMGSYVQWEDWSNTVVITSDSPYGKGEEIVVRGLGEEYESVIKFESSLPFRDVLRVEVVDDTYINIFVTKPSDFILYLDRTTFAGRVNISGEYFIKRGNEYFVQYNVKQYTDREVSSFKCLGFRFCSEMKLFFEAPNPLYKN